MVVWEFGWKVNRCCFWEIKSALRNTTEGVVREERVSLVFDVGFLCGFEEDESRIGGSWGFGGCENGVVEEVVREEVRVFDEGEPNFGDALKLSKGFWGRHKRMFSITSSGTILLFGGEDLTELKAGSGGPGD